MTTSVKVLTVLMCILIVLILLFIACFVSLLPVFIGISRRKDIEEFNKKYGHPDCMNLEFYISDGLLFRHDSRFWLYNDEGKVVDVATNEDEAISRHEKEGLYILYMAD